MSFRIALGVEYDGSEYFGFQKQKSTNQTIQGLLEASASRVADHKVKTFCSGRTDAGVHAFMQVIHFDTEATRTPSEWLRGINSSLPSAFFMESIFAPISSIPNFLNVPFSAKARAVFKAVWPPMVGIRASGVSFLITFVTKSGVMGSM